MCSSNARKGWPPTSDDPAVCCPVGIDRIGESQRHQFASAAAVLKVNIAAFFRADADLGDGNDSEAAIKELTDQLDALHKNQDHDFRSARGA
jgi:hypothetical protein